MKRAETCQREDTPEHSNLLVESNALEFRAKCEQMNVKYFDFD